MTDAARPGSVLVVGGGVAGFAAVRELRRRGYAGELTLVDPQGLPYDRPPLSKEFLTVAADLVVAAVGIVPDTALAEAARLAVDGGILVDAAGRTSHPAVFAAGDAVRRRAQEGEASAAAVPAHAARHWEPALHSGQDVAAAILGEDVPARGTPWFWSDRHGVHVEGVGSMLPVPGGRIVDRAVRGTVVAGFALDADGRMTGAAAVDDPTAVKAARRIIDRGIVVDPARLADPDVPVRALLRG